MLAGTKQIGAKRVTNGLTRAGKGVYGARRKVATCAALMLTVMVGYHVVFGQNGLTAYRSKQHEMHDLSGEMRMLQGENGRLKEHVDRLGNDPNSIEHEAREALHYTRPGEVIYTLPDTRAAAK